MNPAARRLITFSPYGPERIPQILAGWTDNANITHTLTAGMHTLTATGTSALTTTSASFAAVAGRRYRLRARIRADAANAVANSCRLYLMDEGGAASATVVTTNGPETTINYLYQPTVARIAYVLFEIASGVAWGAVGDKAYCVGLSVREERARR